MVIISIVVNQCRAKYDTIPCKKTRRLLRGGHGHLGHSGGSHRSGYYRDYSKYTGSFANGRSYSILYVYYLPPDFCNPDGYTTKNDVTYYDGYGWNFYY